MHYRFSTLATIFLSPLFPFPTGVTILVFVMISVFAAKLASPVSPPIPAFIGDDTSCETHRVQ